MLSLEAEVAALISHFLFQKAPDGLPQGPSLCQGVLILLPVYRGLRNVFFRSV